MFLLYSFASNIKVFLCYMERVGDSIHRPRLKIRFSNPFLFTFKILFVSHKQINFWFVVAKIWRIFVICKFILGFLLNFYIVDDIVYPLSPSPCSQETVKLSCFLPSQRVEECFEFFFHHFSVFILNLLFYLVINNNLKSSFLLIQVSERNAKSP